MGIFSIQIDFDIRLRILLFDLGERSKIRGVGEEDSREFVSSLKRLRRRGSVMNKKCGLDWSR